MKPRTLSLTYPLHRDALFSTNPVEVSLQDSFCSSMILFPLLCLELHSMFYVLRNTRVLKVCMLSLICCFLRCVLLICAPDHSLNLHTRNLSLYCRVCTDCASCYTKRAAFDSCPFSFVSGGAEGIRTPRLFNAIEALSQMSYSPRDPTHSIIL